PGSSARSPRRRSSRRPPPCGPTAAPPSRSHPELRHERLHRSAAKGQERMPRRPSMTTNALPDLVPDTKIKLPRSAERTLAGGLTVIAVRRAAVPLVEVRLRVPFGRAPLPRATLLSQALFTGTGTMSSIDIAAELQVVGGGLSAGLDPDRLLVTGNSLTAGLDRMLEILAAVLTDPAYPSTEVAVERERLVDHIQVAQSQPAHLARTALLKRMYGRHPYAVQTPEPEQIKGVRPAQLRALH